MKFLSRRRRHPLAGLVVILLGLLAAGALYSATVKSAVAEDDAVYDEELIEQGRQLFTVGCSSCHGLNAEGIPTKSGNQYGPPLIGVGAAAVDFQVGTGRMPMQRPDVQAPQKTVVYTDEEIEALAAFVASLGPGPAIPAPEDYDPADGDPVRGGEFFFTNCTACHNFSAKGGALPSGRYAPSLFGVEPRHMYEAMITGPQQMPVFNDSVLSSQDKRDIIAYVQSIEAQPAYGGSALGSLGPVTEGLWGWLLGIGALVLAATWIGNNGVRAGKK